MKEIFKEAELMQMVQGYKMNPESRRKELGMNLKCELLSYIGVGENKDLYANSFMEGLIDLKKDQKTA